MKGLRLEMRTITLSTDAAYLLSVSRVFFEQLKFTVNNMILHWKNSKGRFYDKTHFQSVKLWILCGAIYNAVIVGGFGHII